MLHRNTLTALRKAESCLSLHTPHKSYVRRKSRGKSPTTQKSPGSSVALPDSKLPANSDAAAPAEPGQLAAGEPLPFRPSAVEQAVVARRPLPHLPPAQAAQCSAR